jgi:hypothetical protein
MGVRLHVRHYLEELANSMPPHSQNVTVPLILSEYPPSVLLEASPRDSDVRTIWALIESRGDALVGVMQSWGEMHTADTRSPLANG